MIYRVQIKNIGIHPPQWQWVLKHFNTENHAIDWIMKNTDLLFIEYQIIDDKGITVYEMVNNKDGEPIA